MDNYALRIKIEMPDGELEKILNELTAAQETIYKCYSRLRELGFVTITEKPTVATDGNSRMSLEEFEKLYEEMKATHSNRGTL